MEEDGLFAYHFVMQRGHGHSANSGETIANPKMQSMETELSFLKINAINYSSGLSNPDVAESIG
jgi:hypothetical protein